MSEPRLIPETMDLVWFSGPDAVRFLNDLISQEIAKLEPGSVVRSFLLEPRGKLDHLLWVLRDHERVGLATGEGRGADLVSKLGRYRIRVQVEIDEPATCWLLLGDESVDKGTWVDDGGVVSAGLPWEGPRLCLRSGERPDLASLPAEDWEAIRIEAMEPRFGVDVDSATIPQESGLVQDAVDFSKGCYLGQELVARIDSRGHVNRHLRLLRFTDGLASPGAEIAGEEAAVGTVTSVAADLGLAMVRREVEVGSTVNVGDVEATVVR